MLLRAEYMRCWEFRYDVWPFKTDRNRSKLALGSWHWHACALSWHVQYKASAAAVQGPCLAA